MTLVLLPVMARRLAGGVGSGLLGFNEALGTLMAAAVGRGACDAPNRLLAVQEWLTDLLTREVEAWRAQRRQSHHP